MKTNQITDFQKNNLSLVLAAAKLSRLPGMGAALFKEILLREQCPHLALANYCPQTTSAQSLNKTPLDIDLLADFLEKNSHIECTYFGAPNYPKSLEHLSEPPPLLFMQGNWQQLLKVNNPLAVVGARKMSSSGRMITTQCLDKIAFQYDAIVSGLAQGVDSIAHQFALDHQLFTVGVIATGIDVIYPKTNSKLFNQINENGCIVTEFFPDTQPRASFFPTRNRIIAGLSAHILLTEASAKSGALYTVKNAIKQDKSVFIPDVNYSNQKNLLWQGLEVAEKYGAIRLSL